MADFCVALKMRPAEFKELTLVEYQALANAFAKTQGSTDLQEMFG